METGAQTTVAITCGERERSHLSAASSNLQCTESLTVHHPLIKSSLHDLRAERGEPAETCFTDLLHNWYHAHGCSRSLIIPTPPLSFKASLPHAAPCKPLTCQWNKLLLLDSTNLVIPHLFSQETSLSSQVTLSPIWVTSQLPGKPFSPHAAFTYWWQITGSGPLMSWIWWGETQVDYRGAGSLEAAEAHRLNVIALQPVTANL